MATTTNYSWSTPDDTALVKDGAAAIRSLGTAIDSTVFTNAGAAINKTIIDAAGDLIYGTAADTAARLAIGTANQVLTVNSGATAPQWTTISTGGMTLISTTTLTGSSVTLSSIPATYNNLQVVIRNARPNTDNTTLKFRFNADSNSNRHHQRAFSSDVQDQLIFNATDVTFTGGDDDTTGQGLTIIDFPDYANTTTWKMAKSFSLTNDHTDATNFDRRPIFSFYNQTSAISSLSFFPSTGNFAAGTILLYGVK